jgi:uncharacterized membrane protein YfcA
MELIFVAVVALVAALLTFFTGFGLGTILLPAFALFVPVQDAVAMTAAVHLANGILKLALVARHVAWRVVLVFGVPAIAGALAGAWLLVRVADAAPLAAWGAHGHTFVVTPAKLVVGILLALFALAEFLPVAKRVAVPPRWLALGGACSGFFGGLAGMQGALRSAFLVRGGLTREGYVGTSAAIASLVDITRLGIYLPAVRASALDIPVLGIALAAAMAGTILGTLLLSKVPLRTVERLVALVLVTFAAGLASGVL